MIYPTRRASLGGVAFGLLVAGVLAGCSPGPVTVPADGQVVHVAVDGLTVRLEPTTVRAGDIYLVLDNPMTDINLVKRGYATAQTPGPLSDDELDRIVHGEEVVTSLESGFANSEQYGNVSKLVLGPGKYLFVTDSPMALAGRSGGVVPPESMAVLDVLP